MVGMEGEVSALEEVEDVEEDLHSVAGDVVLVASQVDIMIMENLWLQQSQVGVSYVEIVIELSNTVVHTRVHCVDDMLYIKVL